jgi:hypothetical protein
MSRTVKMFRVFNRWVVPRDVAEIRIAEHNQKEGDQGGVQVWCCPPISVLNAVELVTGVFL